MDASNLPRFFRKQTTSYYHFMQYYATDDENDYINVLKVTEGDLFISNAYIRKIYYRKK